MIHIVWDFRVRPGRESDFEIVYGPTGAWARLFAKSAGYHHTVLTRDTQDPGHYLLTDVWRDLESFQDLRERFGGDYNRLDREGAEMTEAERCLGHFEVIP